MRQYGFLLLLLLAVTLAAGLTACGGGDDPDEPKPPVVNPDNPGGGGGGTTTYTLSLSTTSLSFDMAGGEQTVNVTTNATSWTAQSNQSWCRTAQSGQTLTVSADANSETQQRTATITITATGVSQPQTITVTQAPAPAEPYLVVGQDLQQIVFDDRGGTQTLDVQTNYDEWTVSSNGSAFTATKLSARQVSISCNARTDGGDSPIAAWLQFDKTDGTTLASLRMVQDPKPVFGNMQGYNVSPQGGTWSFPVDVNTSAITARSLASWIEVKEVGYDGGNYVTLTFSARKEGEEPRYGLVEFTAHYVTATMAFWDSDGGSPDPTIGGEGYGYGDNTPWD